MARKKSRWKHRKRGDPIVTADELMDTNDVEHAVMGQVFTMGEILYGSRPRQMCRKARFAWRALENLLIEDDDNADQK